MAETQEAKSKSSDRDSLLKEIRENYDNYLLGWKEIRDEAQIDMRYISGDPWSPKERQIREDAKRPCMAWDELSQYVNQLVNDPKQNPRAIRISPLGNGANDKTAETRKGMIDAIQYNSKAQMAYTTGFQGAVERSYGFWRVGKRFVSSNVSGPEAFNQELYIGRIPNPDSVLYDDNFKEMDASDAMGCFVLDRIRRTDYKRKYPKASITDFTTDHSDIAPKWIGEQDVMVAEYWRVTLKQRTAHLFEDKTAGHTVVYEDELPAGFDLSTSKRQRRIEQRVVTQYITNGIEILDETEIEIPWIPIIPVFGKEHYIDEGSGPKRILMSLIRLARDPYMAYCYFRSQEAEESSMTPRAPVIGYTGQFESQKEYWETINKVPRGYIQIDPIYDENGTLLPPPQRQPFQPNFEAYEVACEAARRAIRSAIGIADLPTAAQRNNEKSGVALKQIESQEDRGSFHFIDNYNMAIEHTGRILDAWIPYVYDTSRDVGIRKPDESDAVIRINDPNAPNAEGIPEERDVTTGDHGITISVGPSSDSLREEASDFLDTLIQNLQSIPAAPPQLAKLLALAIKAKRIGALGDQMADIISPPEDEQAKANQSAQMQQQLQQQQEFVAALQTELQQLRLEKAGKVIDNQYKLQIQQMENHLKAWQTQTSNDLKAFIAEIQTKAQQQSERSEFMFKYIQDSNKTAHEAGIQATDHAHEHSITDKNAANAQLAQVSESGDSTNSPQGATQ